MKRLLADKGHDTDETWSSITKHEGSVQHLDFLGELEKEVFKTAFEIDQRWIIELGADRASYICQSQSVNLFLPADIHKRDLHQLHFQAWKQGMKSLYYCRSKSLQRSESIASTGPTDGVTALPMLGKVNSGEQPLTPLNTNDYEECLSCQ